MFKHILVPTDGSAFSREAVLRAVDFARDAGARITVVHVRKPGSSLVEGLEVEFSVIPPTFDALGAEMARQALNFAGDLCRQAGVECTQLSVDSDNVHQAIIDAATKNGCELIFMASHGRSGLGAVLLGSVTNKVLTHAKIPVLVCR